MSERWGMLFAGQGAQVVGMGRDLAATYPAAARLFNEADAVLGRSLSGIAFDGPAEELTQTVNCQPALYVHGLACVACLRDEMGPLPIVAAAGLSLGEFTAHAAAGTFEFATGLQLVAERGRLMQEACENSSGAMTAMIGGEESAVRALAARTSVDVANLNCPGQVVLAGERGNITAAISLAKEHGVRRATLLNVAGAYHSRLMSSAAEKLGGVLRATMIHPPRFSVICNVEARPVSEEREIRRSLLEQVTGTVRWTETIEYLLDVEKCDLLVEFGPGGVLAGLVGRIRKGTPVLSIHDVSTLQAAVAVLRQPGAGSSTTL